MEQAYKNKKDGMIMKSFQYEIKDDVGIHARPAGLFVKKAKSMKAGLRSV